jgi:DNA phosphorothioation-dependent restriction protein DptH
MLNAFIKTLMENSLYFYLSQLILKYFQRKMIRDGSRFHIYFEKESQVRQLYECLRVYTDMFYSGEVEVGTFQFYNYETFYLVIGGKKLIVAYHANGDFLTGIRNHFDQTPGFKENTAILFIHNTELESITKGAENLSTKGLPLHIDSVKQNIVQTFSEDEENSFSKAQKDFIKILLNYENSDYQIESTSLFDLKKYLDILHSKRLERADYLGLGVFYDEEIQTKNPSRKQIEARLIKNLRWFNEITQTEQLNTLDEYLEKHFDREGQNKLRKRENWINVSYDDIEKFSDNRDKIKFNDYQPNTSEVTEEQNVLWDKPDGSTKKASQSRNILIFNPKQHSELNFQLFFKRKPNIKNITAKGLTVEALEGGNGFNVRIKLTNPHFFQHGNIQHEEEKEGKKINHWFKVLVAPFDHKLFLAVRSIFKIQKLHPGIEFYSDSNLVFNDQGEETTPVAFESKKLYFLQDTERLTLKLDDLNITDSAEFAFSLNYGSAMLNAKAVIFGIKPTELSGWALWRKKESNRKSVYYSTKIDEKSGRPNIVLEHDNQRYFPSGKFRETLSLEEKIIDSGYPFHRGTGAADLEGFNETLPEDLLVAYHEIIMYFRSRNKGSYRVLPSTVFIDDELRGLYTSYVQIYLHHLNGIEPNQALTRPQWSLLRIGSLEDASIYNRLRLSPLHPLNVIYQLRLSERTVDQELPNQIFSKLSALNLLPFMNNGVQTKNYFIGVKQDHSPGWLHYVNAEMEGQSINRQNAPEIVSSKIMEFVKHFSFLYIDPESPIRINLMNVGDGLEILQGIFRYIFQTIERLAKEEKNLLAIHPILISIYGSESYTTKFEQFSKFDEIGEIRRNFQVDLTELEDIIHPDDLLRLYHQKVQFFIKEDVGTSGAYDYAHISFYQFNEDDLERADNNMREIGTGVSLGGLMSDLPSVLNHGNYRTGFGTRTMPGDPNMLTDLSKRLNALAHVAGTASIFKEELAFATVINSGVSNKLLKVYESSQWITFINPMVDLSFFKSQQDIVIIHYTDQYGNSSGYDSITITTKWEQYEFILKEYLSGKVEGAAGAVKPIINMFNALNGYWLLRLGSQNYQEAIQKEKISILSAVKEMLAILDHPDFIWVALSMEEILRVTGSAGLAQSHGLFTKKNLEKTGQYSDDLLMVGLEMKDGKLQLHFYPVEVKIGNNNAATLAKGAVQGAQTARLLSETLNQSGLTGAIYRNYFSKLILNAAQKLALYEVWPGYTQKWEKVEEYRGKLLNDDFVIGLLESYLGEFAVLSFRNNEFSDRSIKYAISDSPYLLINLYESDGLNDLTQTVDALKARYQSATAVGITATDLFSNIYGLSAEELAATREYVRLATAAPLITDVDEEGEDLPLGEEPDTTAAVLNFSAPLAIAAEPEAEYIAAAPGAPAASAPKEPLKILFGTRANDGRPVEWFPTSTDKVMHTNTGIIGTMGTGKTQFTKSLITQLLQNTGNNVDGKPIGVLIFDYKGDYIKDDFVNATGAKVFELHHLPYNPLALFLGKNPKKLLPLHTASTLQDTILKAFNLGNKQRATLKDSIMGAYAEKGINRSVESTWTKECPTMADVCQIYLNDDKSPIDTLHAVLSDLYDFEIFEPDGAKATGLYELLDGVVVINLNGYSPQIQNLVVAITLDLFYAQMQIQGHSKIDGNFRQINKMILVDEADNFLSKNFESLRKILKEGREFGVGTILSTQFLNHFATDENEYSNYILTWIIHRVNEIKDKEVASLFDLPNKNDRDELITVIKQLEKHYSIVNLANAKPVKIKDKAFWELIQ